MFAQRVAQPPLRSMLHMDVDLAAESLLLKID